MAVYDELKRRRLGFWIGGPAAVALLVQRDEQRIVVEERMMATLEKQEYC